MLEKVVSIDDKRIKIHLDGLVRNSVEETLNSLLDSEADALCGAQRYERSTDRIDTRAGSYERQLHTKAGEVTLKVPKLRTQTFETAIIERYKRREATIEEPLIEMCLAGVSVRRVEDITEALWGTRVSPSTVSKLNKNSTISLKPDESNRSRANTRMCISMESCSNARGPEKLRTSQYWSPTALIVKAIVKSLAFRKATKKTRVGDQRSCAI